jgi:excisionase family DNA binding protein
MRNTNKKGGPGKAPPKVSSSLDDTRLAYSMREVATAIGVSERSVWAMCNRGELRSIRIGRSVRIPREALAELLGGAS